MKATDIVKQIMMNKTITNAQLAKRLNCSNSVIFERLKQKNISIDLLLDMLNVLDYQIVIQPNTSKIRDGEFKINKGDNL